jgi:DNA-binding XRE family transcriptional regulator
MMNKLHQNLRVLRDLKGWNQETMAELLDLSKKAYERIEQGKTDVQLSRLEQIAKLFEVEVADLFNLDRGLIFKLSIHNSHTTITNYSQLVNSPCTTTTLEHELEKARLVIEQQGKLLEQKDKEIGYLKEIIQLMKKG